MFERLNNDLGLQRLFASRGSEDSGRAGATSQPARKEKTENRQSSNIPPLGELVAGGPNKPVVARRINQPGLPPLLGPRDSAIPEPVLRAEYRGLTAGDEIALSDIQIQPAAPAQPKGPDPIQPVGQLLLSAGVPLVVEAVAEKDPEPVEHLLEIAAAEAMGRERQAAVAPAAASWQPGDAAAPMLAFRLRPPGESSESGEEASRPATASMEPAMLQNQRELGSGQPLRGLKGEVARDAVSAIEPTFEPRPPAAERRLAALSFRPTGQVASGRVVSTTALNRCSLPAEPLGLEAECALPRLRLSPEAIVEPKPHGGIRLPEAPALWSASTARTPAAVAGHAACESVLALPGLDRGIAWDAAPGAAALEGLGLNPVDSLLTWQVPAFAPVAALPGEPGLPASGLRPELMTVEQALELEVVDAAEQILPAEAPVEAVQAAEQEEEPGPPLHDAQRLLGVIRPSARPALVSTISNKDMTPVWGQSLQASALCPTLRLKLDHADGSGSRSLRSTSRQKATKQRLLNVQEKIPGGRFWRNAPADLKWIALALPLILALVVWSFRGSVAPVEASLPQQPDPSKTVVAKQVSRLQQVLLSRAAVRLYDDFRGGLGAWSGREGWARTWKYNDSSFLEPGDLAIYQPTLEMRDYSVEFLGQIERRSLNWIFRAKDLQNYYAMRIVITKGGPLPSASLVRYAVIGGKEKSHLTLPLPMSIRPDTVYRVRMDVRGKQFTTYVQGQVVDNFEDDRLAEGGIGFWSPRGDSSLLRWVEVMHQYDYLGRLCALLAPYPLQSGGQQAD